MKVDPSTLDYTNVDITILAKVRHEHCSPLHSLRVSPDHITRSFRANIRSPIAACAAQCLYLDHSQDMIIPLDILTVPLNALGASWKLPDWLPTAEYWIAITPTGDPSNVLGFAPKVKDGNGNSVPMSESYFNVIRDGCQSHDECPADEYCDSERFCFSCDVCEQTLDVYNIAAGGECPSKCNIPAWQVGGTLPPSTLEVEVVGRIRDVIVNGSPQHTNLSSFTDVNNKVWKVSGRINELLETLRGLVNTHPRLGAVLNAGIVLYEAYTQPPSDVTLSTVNYHHEARAVRCALVGVHSLTVCSSRRFQACFHAVFCSVPHPEASFLGVS